MTSSRRRARRICNLHDCLSLGEVELGLTVSAPTTPAATPIGEVGQLRDALLQPQDRNINARPPDPEHIRHRLPLLLRLLQDSRPLSSIPDVMLVGQETSIKVLSSAEQKQGEAEPKTEGGTATTEKKAEEPNDDVVASAPPPRKKRDDLVQGAVDRLEDRVAMDPTAEDVEGVACRLAPLACRRMLRHHRARGGGGGGRRRTTLHSLSDHDVQMLLSSGATSTSNPTTKRTKLASTTSLKPSPNQQDVEDADSDDDSGRFDTGNPPPQDASKDPISEDRKKRRRMSSALASSPSRASLIQMARGEDAPETTVSRTLEELVRLVRAYSTPQVSQSAFVAGRDVAAAAEDDGTRPWLDETMLDDSILAQEGRSHRLATVSGSGSDVPSTVASLLHHAPILQAKDVAEAVCRAALPQASAIVSRIGANAPSCVPSLIGGCLRALQQRPVATATGSASSPPPRRRDATTTAVQKSLRALAKLSPRESSRVRTALSASFDSKEYSRSDRAMLLALRLELLNVAATDAAIGDDDGVEAASLEVACLVNEHYSSSHFSSNNGNDRDRDDDNDDDNDDAEQQADENQDDADEEDAGRGARAEDSGGAGRRRNDEGAGASPTESNRHLPSRSQQGSSLLHGILCENHNLVRETLNVLRKELIRQRSHDDGQMPTAQFSIVSAAVTWILLSVPLSELDDKQGADNPFHALLHELQAWVARIRSLQYYALREEMTRRGLERAFRRLVSASFAGLCAALLVGDKSNHTPDLCDVCISMLSDLLLLLPQSIPVPGISSFSARFLLRSGRHDVLSLIEASLLQVEPTFDPVTEPNEIVTRACRRLCSEFTSEQQDRICLELPSRTSAPIDLEYGLDLVGDVLLPENKRSDRLRELLERLLERSAAADHLQNPITPAFIESSVFFFAHRQGPSSLPIIHPVTLERLAIHLTFERTRSLSGDEKHFILCLYYWFVYRHFAKIETFSVDFRSLPIVAVRYICMNAHRFGLCASLGSRLRCWIDNFCPESHQKKAFSYQSHDEASRLTKAQLLRTLRRSVETPQLDPSGIVAEKAFIAARRCMPESTYITTTVSAFFSEPNNLPPFFTYASLYRDPLVLLKCAIDVWKRRGLRRIILSVLEALLRTNDRVLQEASPSEELKLELYDARNLLLTRSLVTLMTVDLDPLSVFQRIPSCSLTLLFIRKTIARNPGTFASMLKQGLPSISVDWMIDWVPECVVDSTRISVLLTQRSSIGAPERLTIADSAFRLAIMQGGGFGSENASKQLVVAALSQLVSSFFLVLGPVGVPVAAILGSGHDATMVARNAAFRILNAMRRVHTYRSEVRAECIIAVQKLVGLCKGENILAGLPGAVASRQKKLLKELIDALSRANNAMGNAQIVIQQV